LASSTLAREEVDRLPQERVLNVCAWGVHAYTATGAALGLFAIEYAVRGDYHASFLTMAAATAIDATDGTLARAFDVKHRIPIFDGAMLDNVIDYVTFVAAPVVLMLCAGILPSGGFGMLIGGCVMVASAYGFCRVDAKTEDHFFVGFPSYWNVVALYLFCFGRSRSFNVLIVSVLTAMVFVPIKYIYPNRTRPLRRVTFVLTTIWAVLTLATIVELPNPSAIVLFGSFAYSIYYFAASFFLFARSLRGPSARGLAA
jgi:phosphatidylcholine synthase